MPPIKLITTALLKNTSAETSLLNGVFGYLIRYSSCYISRYQQPIPLGILSDMPWVLSGRYFSYIDGHAFQHYIDK